MQRLDEIKQERKQRTTTGVNVAAFTEQTRTHLTQALNQETPDWRQYKLSFISAKELVTGTHSLADLKLWYSLFNKAVKFKAPREQGINLNEEYRRMVTALVDIMDVHHGRLEDFPNDETAFNNYKAAVEYRNELVYPDYIKVQGLDSINNISIESHITGLKKLEDKRWWDGCKANWCCCFFPRGQQAPAAAAAENSESQYRSLKRSII